MTSPLVVHPSLILCAAALLLPFLRGRARDSAVLLAPALAMVALWLLPEGRLWQAVWLDYHLAPLVVDKLSRLFATVFTLMAFAGGLFALRQNSRLEIPAAFLYAGSAIGVVLAGDLVTVFVCWEIMAIASTLVIWSANTPLAWSASLRYAMIHLASGVVLFAGICGHLLSTGDATFTHLHADSIAHWLILVGFLVNAGAPPLSAWLADAYPEASWSGTVFLSAFTTKTAVYVLLRGFPGSEVLIWVGLFMIFYGIIYALLENDMRRILAYSIVNQVGFMVVGIGIGSEIALNGAAAHAFCHIIYQGLLLMSAGTVMAATGRRKCSELGGLFHSMPLTTVCGSIGALAISAFPLTSGFISKSMIAQAAVDGQLQMVWLLLAAASAGVFLHAGIKYPWFVFFQKDSGLRPADPPASMRWAMIFFAFLCIALGIWPEPLYALLPYPTDFIPYTGAHVVTQLQLLLFSGLAFFVALPYLKRMPTITLDFDWLWRRAFPTVSRRISACWQRIAVALSEISCATATMIEAAITRQRQPNGTLVRSWPTRSMAMWGLVMLLAYLLGNYLGK